MVGKKKITHVCLGDIVQIIGEKVKVTGIFHWYLLSSNFIYRLLDGLKFDMF